MKKSHADKSNRVVSNSLPISVIQLSENEVGKKNILEIVKVQFECPKCHWIIRREKPDEKHPIPSVVKPCENNLAGDVVVQSCVCRNPRCQVSFVVYWFDPIDFLKRI